jgi:tetratricopeptide (TPR) repeat protein/O-antigen ligase
MTTARPTSRVEAISEGIIEAGWLLALGLVPLFFNIYSSRSYEPDKVALLRSLAVVMVGAWAWKVACGGRAYRSTNVSGEPMEEPEGSQPGIARQLLRVCREVPPIPLVGMLALALVLGSVLSIDPRLSWLGSYPRAQGAWTQFAYLAVFGIAAAHLRTGAQWRRVTLVMVTASASVSAYALFQAAGMDPVETTRHGTRVHSSLGNSIFLGGYLLMVVFVTVVELGRHLTMLRAASEGNAPRSGEHAWIPVLRVTVLAAVVGAQLVVLVLTKSRGPFLGLLAGGYIFALLVLLLARRSAADPAVDSRRSRIIRWAVPATAAAALLGVLLLIAFNAGSSPLSRFRDAPYLGRLVSVLDPESRTIQVRLFIWRGVAELLASDEPLIFPDGRGDPFHGLRPVIGNGPETFAIAVNRFVSPRLGQLEDRAATPDRAHNEAFDLMVMQGLLGVIVWLGVLGTVISGGLRQLGLIDSSRESARFWLVFLGGSALGSAAPWLASGEATLSGVGLSVGLVLGLALFVTLQSLLRSRRGVFARSASPVDALVVALLATVVAHIVEVQVGIAVTTTRLYFWFLAAALVVLARGWRAVGSDDAASPAVTATAPRSGPTGRRKPSHAAKGQGPRPRASSDSAVISVLTGALCLPWIYSMTAAPKGAPTVGAVLASSWLGRDGASGLGGISVLGWLVVTTILVGGTLGARVGSREAGSTGRRRLQAPALVLGVVGLFAIVQAVEVAHAARRAASVSGLPAAAEFSANLYSVFVWTTVALCLVIGIALGLRRGSGSTLVRGKGWLPASAAVVIIVGSIVMIQRNNIDPIRADVLMKTAGHLVTAGRVDEGIAILDRAVELDPTEPRVQLNRGGIILKAAVAADDGARREELFDRAEVSLDGAQVLAPLDPDHAANLARLHTTRASLESDPELRAELMQRASDEYEAALRLRPTSVVFLNERGRLLLSMGQHDKALLLLERAVDLDPQYAEPYVALGALWERTAAVSSNRGEAGLSLEYLERAATMYGHALQRNPGHESARQGLARVRRAMASVHSSSLS